MLALSPLKSAVTRMLGPVVFRALGMDIFHYMSWLESTDKWTSTERGIWRLRRLNAILDFCWHQVPFYRSYWGDHGVRWEPLRSLEELASYPVVKKELLQSEAEAFIPDNLHEIPHKDASTGGSTGQPIRYRQDLELHSLRYAFLWRGWGLAGYRFGDPVVVISGGRLLPDLQKPFSRGSLRARFTRHYPLIGVHMDRELARDYHDRIVRCGAHFLRGHPSMLSEFALHLAEQDLKLPQLRAVVTTAEMLLPKYRKNIEENLGCRVWDEYGCNDGGILSWECHRHDGLHYNDLECIAETVDGESGASGASGASGQLLITNLWNRSLPFIRYENGDLIKLASTPCPCGQQFPVIESVNGRTADVLRFSNGRSLLGPALTAIFRDLPVDAWQVIQTGTDQVEVLLKSASRVPDNAFAHVEKVLKAHSGMGVGIKVKQVDSLRLTAQGKLKPVWLEAN